MDINEEDVIIEVSSNEFRTLIYVTKSTQKVLSAGKDSLKKRIQDDTNTTVKCSKSKIDGASKRTVEIKGTTHNDVYAARQQIKSIGANGNNERIQTLPTHFTCVKITDATIKANYLKFKEGVLNSENITDTHRGSFMKPEKLHITFGVMRLPTDDCKSQAKQVLTECLQKIILPTKTGKIEFRVRGLEIMKGSPENARVVYAKIESDSLQTLGNNIAKSFNDAGFGKREDVDVKLHMTVMNIKYAKSRKRKAKSFDASHIFEQFRQFEFGNQEVNQVLLVEMKDKDADGFYKRIAYESI